jgi:multidrug efflux pump subunit AcrA (membrane-fusion protein)
VDRLRVLVDLPESEVRHFQVGNPAKVDIPALGLSLSGRTGRASARLESSAHTLRVEIDLENRDGTVLPGVFADVTLDLETHALAVVVPSGALMTERRRKFAAVLVPEGGGYVARRREVKVGIDDGIVAEILEGLDGSEILAKTPSAVADGEAIAAIQEPR